MMDFIVGKVYNSKLGVPYKLLQVNGEVATIQHLLRVRKARIIKYCGVNALTFDFGKDMIFAEEIKPIEDETIEYGYNHKEITINKSGESYVSLFKEHKKQEANQEED